MRSTGLPFTIQEVARMTAEELRELKEDCRKWYEEHVHELNETSRMYQADIARLIDAEIERRERGA